MRAVTIAAGWTCGLLGSGSAWLLGYISSALEADGRAYDELIAWCVFGIATTVTMIGGRIALVRSDAAAERRP